MNYLQDSFHGDIDFELDEFHNETSGGENENCKYSCLKISTITLHGEFSHPLNLQALYENLNSQLKINYDPKNKKSKIKKKKGEQTFYNSSELKLKILDRDSTEMIESNVSVMPFPNGKFKIAGCKTIKTCNCICWEIIDILKDTKDVITTEEEFNIKKLNIAMICSDFIFKPLKEDPDGWCLKQEDLKNIFNCYPSVSATYSPLSRYPGINVKYPSPMRKEKMVTLLIFRSGSIIITGANNIYELKTTYKFIVDVLKKHVEELFYYDIGEDLKVKKKRKSAKKKAEAEEKKSSMKEEEG